MSADEKADKGADETLEFRPKFNADGLLTAVAVDAASGQLLMVAHMNAESLERTLETGEAWYWSRSRAELWHKGATSGHIQRIVEIRIDCDQDAVQLVVDPAGPACHTGRVSCFYRVIEDDGGVAKLRPVD